MAGKKYNITLLAPIEDIKNALIDKFGLPNVTIYYQTIEYLVFRCDSISNKVIKIRFFAGSSSRLWVYYGNAWTSTTVITNEVQIMGVNIGSVITEINFIARENFIFIHTVQSDYQHICIIGTLTNADYVILGFSSSPLTNYNINARGINLVDNANLYPITYDRGFTTNGKLYKQNLLLISDLGLEINSDGTPATIEGIYNVSHSSTYLSYNQGANFIIIPSNLYMTGNVKVMGTSLMIEFEPSI